MELRTAPNPSSPAANTGRRGVGRVLAVLAVAAVALLVRSHVTMTYVVTSESMAPTVNTDDRIVVDRLSPTDQLDRGAVIVFDRPDPTMRDEHLVKRVIGLPGESVGSQDGQVTIDGEPISERYLPPGTATVIHGTIKVPDGHVFVLGDNRGDSLDSRSRSFGTIPISAIDGRARLTLWPPRTL